MRIRFGTIHGYKVFLSYTMVQYRLVTDVRTDTTTAYTALAQRHVEKRKNFS